jgi:hypothetical protein
VIWANYDPAFRGLLDSTRRHGDPARVPPLRIEQMGHGRPHRRPWADGEGACRDVSIFRSRLWRNVGNCNLYVDVLVSRYNSE